MVSSDGSGGAPAGGIARDARRACRCVGNERPVVDCLANMGGIDLASPVERGNRARHVADRRFGGQVEAQLADRNSQQVQRDFRQRCGHLVAVDRTLHLPPQIRQRRAWKPAFDLARPWPADFDVDLGDGDLAAVARDLCRRASADALIGRSEIAARTASGLKGFFRAEG